MKKFVIFLIALSFVTGGTVAFGQGAPKPIFGAKGGLNFADILGENTETNKIKTAFHAGVYSEVYFDYFLMAQVEFLVSYQGHTESESDNSLNLWYINLPVMARYNLGYNFNVHAGVQFGFMLSAKSKFTDFDGVKQKEDVKDFFKGLDFGLPVGVGFEFWEKKMGVTARYIIPISNIAEDPFDTGEVRKNSVIQLSVNIKIMTVDE